MAGIGTKLAEMLGAIAYAGAGQWWERLRAKTASLVAIAVVGSAAFVFLCLALYFYLAERFVQWQAALVTALLVAVLAGCLVVLARRRDSRSSHVPVRGTRRDPAEDLGESLGQAMHRANVRSSDLVVAALVAGLVSGLAAGNRRRSETDDRRGG